MENSERKEFWDALCSIRDNTPEHIQDLCAKIIVPDYLCRFRSVSENSLMQLQENKLYYSSADHYDDPFDTFIHVDIERIRALHMFLSSVINSETPDFVNNLKLLEPVTGINGEQFFSILKNNPLELSRLEEGFKQIRTTIQKNLFSICFCENVLNETLWIKYANNYKGFALVYDMRSQDTFLCGNEEICKNCRSIIERPSVYPVYYSDRAYDATQFALACLLWGESNAPRQIVELAVKNVMWDAERISLIKKKCHEYDEEWRMIRPTMMPDRTCIRMKPSKIVLGLRISDPDRAKVISAANVAGISSIEELYINENDLLDSRPVVGK